MAGRKASIVAPSFSPEPQDRGPFVRRLSEREVDETRRSSAASAASLSEATARATKHRVLATLRTASKPRAKGLVAEQPEEGGSGISNGVASTLLAAAKRHRKSLVMDPSEKPATPKKWNVQRTMDTHQKLIEDIEKEVPEGKHERTQWLIWQLACSRSQMEAEKHRREGHTQRQLQELEEVRKELDSLRQINIGLGAQLEREELLRKAGARSEVRLPPQKIVRTNPVWSRMSARLATLRIMRGKMVEEIKKSMAKYKLYLSQEVGPSLLFAVNSFSMQAKQSEQPAQAQTFHRLRARKSWDTSGGGGMDPLRMQQIIMQQLPPELGDTGLDSRLMQRLQVKVTRETSDSPPPTSPESEEGGDLLQDIGKLVVDHMVLAVKNVRGERAPPGHPGAVRRSRTTLPNTGRAPRPTLVPRSPLVSGTGGSRFRSGKGRRSQAETASPSDSVETADIVPPAQQEQQQQDSAPTPVLDMAPSHRRKASPQSGHSGRRADSAGEEAGERSKSVSLNERPEDDGSGSSSEYSDGEGADGDGDGFSDGDEAHDFEFDDDDDDIDDDGGDGGDGGDAAARRRRRKRRAKKKAKRRRKTHRQRKSTLNTAPGAVRVEEEEEDEDEDEEEEAGGLTEEERKVRRAKRRERRQAEKRRKILVQPSELQDDIGVPAIALESPTEAKAPLAHWSADVRASIRSEAVSLFAEGPSAVRDASEECDRRRRLLSGVFDQMRASIATNYTVLDGGSDRASLIMLALERDGLLKEEESEIAAQQQRYKERIERARAIHDLEEVLRLEECLRRSEQFWAMRRAEIAAERARLLREDEFGDAPGSPRRTEAIRLPHVRKSTWVKSPQTSWIPIAQLLRQYAMRQAPEKPDFVAAPAQACPRCGALVPARHEGAYSAKRRK